MSPAVDRLSARPLLLDHSTTVYEPEAGMGWDLAQRVPSQSELKESGERTSPSQMQRCKMIPPTRQNRNHISVIVQVEGPVLSKTPTMT
jgi:hypothetical protein